MNVELKDVYRGYGRIYMRFSIGSELALDELVVDVASAEGTRLPCFYQALPELDDAQGGRAVVVVTPLLRQGSQVVTVGAVDEDGQLATESFVVAMARAKWESRINRKLHRDIADKVCSVGEADVFDRINIAFEEAIPDGDEMLVNVQFWFEPTEDAELEVAVFDSAGAPIEAHPVFTGDDVRVFDGDPWLRVQVKRYSMRVPIDESHFTVAACERSGSKRSGFATIEDDQFGASCARGRFMWENASSDPIYQGWFLERRRSTGTIERQKRVTFDHDVMFSIIVPLYHTPPALFSEMVESVIAQSYQNWELVLVNSTPEDEALAEAVERYQASDARVRAITLQENRGISENTNAGIRAARGSFIALFDHDDLLEPDALYEYARAIELRPETDVLYCDEDKVTEDGSGFFFPNLKPEFDRELIRSNNYVCHMLCIRKTLLDEIGLLDSRFDGAQDHDLTLRASERARHIHHVARVLYHWRAIPGSTAQTADAKTYAHEAGRGAIQAHIDRIGVKGELVSTPWPFVHRVKYLVQGSPLVSIVIPNKDCAHLLEACVKSILEKTRYGNYEIVIVENNSENPETFEMYDQLKALDGRIKVVTWEGEFNFSKIVNRGVSCAHGEYIVLLNNDTEVIAEEWLGEMLGTCQQDGIGAVGARLLYPDRTLQHVGVVITDSRTGGHHCYAGLPESTWGYCFGAVLRRNCIAVTGACLMVSRADFDLVGGFTEELGVAYNDVDFCLKLREAGLASVYEPAAELYHHESASRSLDLLSTDKRIRLHKEQCYMHSHWTDVYLNGDPWLNPNLASKYFKLHTWENSH